MIRQKCEETEHCVHTHEKLELCETRVGSRSTDEDCTEELFDFLHARDHCVSITVLQADYLAFCCPGCKDRVDIVVIIRNTTILFSLNYIQLYE